MSAAALETRLIPRKLLVLSETESQVERRAHFDKGRIKELAESLDANGMVNPILVRPAAKNGNPATNFEIVAGERRFMAAGFAEWPDVPCSVRELTDQQVIEVQLTENLDREELHELAEAEGYQALIDHGMNAEQIAAKFGRSATYVLRRLRLKTLSKAARRAFYDGKLGFTVALELAKLPIHAHQDELLGEILDRDQWDGPMSAEDVRREAASRYLSELRGAPFPTAEAGLVPKAGACAACPKRSGAQGALFDQVKGLGHCLDLVCFNAKKLAHGENMLAEAKDRGQKVLRNQADVPEAYVRLDHQPMHGGKSVKQLLEKDYVPTLVQLKSGEVVQVASAAEVKKVLPASRAARNDSMDSWKAKQRAEQKKRQLELDYRAELLRLVETETGDAFPEAAERLADLRLACEALADRMHHDGKVRLFKVMEWPVREIKDKYRGKVREYDWEPVFAGHETEADLRKLLRILSVAGDLEVYSHADFDRKDRLHGLATRLGLKPAELLKGMQAAAAAKAKPKKKAKAVRK